MKENTHQTKSEERVLIVAIELPPETEVSFEQSIEELRRLLETLDANILDQVTQKRHTPDPSFYIGRGKVEEMAQKVKELKVSLVAFDNELTGSQQKGLEKELNCRVIDRTGIILDIFSKHARSKEAKNQVEMATLQYLASRLTRRWTHLERQKGGIGLRGLGEKQIELDRRLIRTRIAKLKQEIKHSTSERSVQRRHRDRFLRVALVGYTNAGKSTLMNQLTDANVLVDDRLFATLDATVRTLDPKTKPPILLSDTVGFIKKLPHGLVASFRSTLQEVLEADLLLHVVDASSPTYYEQMEVTQSVLDEIGAGEKPVFLVFNKMDLVTEGLLPKILSRKYTASLNVSAHIAKDMLELRKKIYDFFEKDMLELDLVIPYNNFQLQAQVHKYSRVLKEEYLEEGTQFKIRIMRQDAEWLGLLKPSLNEVSKGV